MYTDEERAEKEFFSTKCVCTPTTQAQKGTSGLKMLHVERNACSVGFETRLHKRTPNYYFSSMICENSSGKPLAKPSQ